METTECFCPLACGEVRKDEYPFLVSPLRTDGKVYQCAKCGMEYHSREELAYAYEGLADGLEIEAARIRREMIASLRSLQTQPIRRGTGS